jgi:hypothetical protein
LTSYIPESTILKKGRHLDEKQRELEKKKIAQILCETAHQIREGENIQLIFAVSSEKSDKGRVITQADNASDFIQLVQNVAKNLAKTLTGRTF